MKIDLFSKPVESIVDAIYDTQMSPELWPEVQKQMCAITGGIGSHILRFDKDNTPLETLIHSSADQTAAQMMEDDYFNWYHQFDDNRIETAIRKGRRAVSTYDELNANDKKKSCVLYNEYFRYYDVQEQLIFGTPLSDGSSLAIVHARPSDMGYYRRDEKQLFGWLAQHVMRATELGSRVNKVFDGSKDLLDIIAHPTRSVIIVNRERRVMWMNDNAQSNLLVSNQVRISRNRLEFENAPQAVLIDRYIKDACNLSVINKTRCGFVSIDIAGVKFALSIFSSSANTSLFSDKTPVAVLVFQDPWGAKIPDEDTLQQYFGLTPAETRLALALAKGFSLQDYADINKLSIHTVRSTLKVIRTKTNTNKQSELVQLLNGFL